MEFSLPELTRCILRASSHDDYRQIIDHAPGTFSLQEAIANDYNTLCIDQILPATDHYPQLTIVDLLPTTRALLTHNASTFIVLAPEAILENEKRQRIAHERASLSTEHVSVKCNIIHKEDDHELIYSLEEDAVLEELNAARVIVQIDEHLPSHVCCGNEEFMQRIACVFDSDDDDDDIITDDNDYHNEENHINEHVNLNGGDSVRCEGGKQITQNGTSSLLKYNDREPYLISIGERMRRFVFVVYPLVKNCDLHDCIVGPVGASNRIDNSTLIKKSNYMYLYAGVDVFRNIRAACLRDASYQSHINT